MRAASFVRHGRGVKTRATARAQRLSVISALIVWAGLPVNVTLAHTLAALGARASLRPLGLSGTLIVRVCPPASLNRPAAYVVSRDVFAADAVAGRSTAAGTIVALGAGPSELGTEADSNAARRAAASATSGRSRPSVGSSSPSRIAAGPQLGIRSEGSDDGRMRIWLTPLYVLACEGPFRIASTSDGRQMTARRGQWFAR